MNQRGNPNDKSQKKPTDKNAASWGSARPRKQESSWSNSDLVELVLNLHRQGKTPEQIFKDTNGRLTLGTIRRWVNGQIPNSYKRKIRNNNAGLFSSVMTNAPAYAKQNKQIITSKGEKDIFDPYTERCRIIYNVKSRKKRRAFPFNRSSIMPSAKELQMRYKYLESLGRPLHNYQKEGIDYIVSGSRRLLADGMGLGKNLTFYTGILTPDQGWKFVQDIEVGDNVVGQNGLPAKVLNKYIWEDVDLYKVRFSDKTSVIACGDHLWSVMRKGRAYRIRKKKGEIEVSDYHVMDTKTLLKKSLVQINKKGKGKNYNYHIPCVEPIQHPEQDLPIDPHILGVYLGDGYGSSDPKNNLLRFAINEEDTDLIEKISTYFKGDVTILQEKHPNGEEKKCFVINVTGEPRKRFVESLKEMGLKGKGATEKFIPQIYKLGSIEQRWKLLCGLMDTDGTVCVTKSSPKSGTSLSFGSSSYKLIHGIRDLVLSLGGIYDIGVPEYKTYLNGEGKKVRATNASWRGRVKLPDNQIPFTIKRQIARYIPCEKYDKPYKNIESITFWKKGGGVCFEVDEPNKLFVVQHYIVTHNTAQCLAALPNPKIAGTIVICPSSVRLGWWDEVKLWRPELEVVAPPKKKFFRFPSAGQIVILGWDSLPKLAPNRPPAIPFVLVCDEAHFAKSEKTARHKKVMHFVNLAEAVVGLTGTPMPNDVTDLWNVFRVCGMQRIPNERMPLIGPRSRFKKTFFLWESKNPRPVGSHPEIAEIINDLTFRRTARDVCDQLPPIRRKREVCDAKPAFVKKLDNFLSQCGGEQGLLNILEKAIEIHERTGDVDDYLMSLRVQIDMAKLPLLQRFVEDYENEGTPLVVYSPFRGIIEILQRRPGWGVITGGMGPHKKKAVQDAFNAGMIKYLGITSAAATGVNLPGPDDNPCFNMIRTSLDWSPAINAQVIKRIDRVAKKMASKVKTTSSLYIIDLYLDHKIDHMVWKTLGAKRMVLDSLGLKEDVEKSKGADPNYFDVQAAPDHHQVNIRFGGKDKR